MAGCFLIEYKYSSYLQSTTLLNLWYRVAYKRRRNRFRFAPKLVLELGHETSHLILQDLELLNGGTFEFLVQHLEVTRVIK